MKRSHIWLSLGVFLLSFVFVQHLPAQTMIGGETLEVIENYKGIWKASAPFYFDGGGVLKFEHQVAPYCACGKAGLGYFSVQHRKKRSADDWRPGLPYAEVIGEPVYTPFPWIDGRTLDWVSEYKTLPGAETQEYRVMLLPAGYRSGDAWFQPKQRLKVTVNFSPGTGSGTGRPANITWAAQADGWRGLNGQRFTVRCPAGGTTSGRLWGTDVYTDDSSICLAAVHAGLIGTAGGTVTIEIRGGSNSYASSIRNGVKSTAYGGWHGSFVFVGKSSPDPPAYLPVTWATQATGWRGQNGAKYRLSCPSGGSSSGRLWGTDLYTDDSSICLAAVHAGLIDTSGGNITIEIRPGAAAYRASMRNGVTSTAYGSWTGSFVFVRQ